MKDVDLPENETTNTEPPVGKPPVETGADDGQSKTIEADTTSPPTGPNDKQV